MSNKDNAFGVIPFAMIKWIYAISIFLISVVVIASNTFDYAGMNSFAFPIIVYIIVCAALIGIYCWRERSVKSVIDKIKSKGDKVIVLFTIVLCLFQIFVGYHICILASWDIGSAIIPCAKAIALNDRGAGEWFSAYYSMFPNNILLCMIYSQIFKIFNISNDINVREGLFAISIVNSILSCITVYLVYFCTKRILNNRWALIAWGISAILLGGSFWYLVTYSDPLTVIIPVGTLAIFILNTSERTLRVLKWFAIGGISLIGFYIKPQSIIVFIAATIIYFIETLINQKGREWILSMLALLIGVWVFSGIYEVACSKFPYEINSEKQLSFSHYMMMGLNDKTQGKYWADDVNFSNSFETRSERMIGNIEEAIRRVKQYGIDKMSLLFIQKTAICYTDGTFGYSDAVQYPEQIYTNGNEVLNWYIQYFALPMNEGFGVIENIYQIFWVFTLIGCFLAGLFFREKNTNYELLLMLTVVGTYLFEMMFEVQPRHLYCNVPIYVILSLIGYGKFFRKKKALLVGEEV